MACVIDLSSAVRDAFQPEGLSIWQSNGPAAHQEVPHVHFHIHPRRTGDDLLRVYPSKPSYPDDIKLEEYAQKIMCHLRC